jgi:3-methylcrotonyl-CoA carboxylase beta subunit
VIFTNQEEVDQVKKGMDELELRISADMNPVLSARQLDTDEIILLGELRSYLETVTEMTYQSLGYRRVKNPRIWSLHDIAALSGEAGG